jgi:hypothetical protein
MNSTGYKAYQVEAFMKQCRCKWNKERERLQWTALCVIDEETLGSLFALCEGSVSDRIDEFKNWYLLAGKYVENPDELPF